MKTHISQLHLRGFKSFNRKTDIIFSPGLNCVIGANGSGKSNVIDGLCFILGRMSSKDLRAENFLELLFRRKTNVAAEGEVSIVFDNSSKVFPFDTKEVEIRRKIKKKGQTQYKVNGKNATRQQVLELLAPQRVFPDGHNIILQGDIAHFVDMRPLERRQIIDEVAGIAIYEERKNRALSELAKVEEKLKEATIILKEKESYMTNLEQEKKGAEQYRELQTQLKSAQATEIKLRMNLAESKKTKTLGEVEKRDQTIRNLKLDMEISAKKLEQHREQITKLEKEIQKKGGEESVALQKSVENIRIELEKARGLVASSLNEIGRIKVRKTDLEKNLADIENKISGKQKEKSEFEAEVDKLAKAESALSKKSDISDLKQLESENETLDKELESLQANVHSLQSDIKISEHELNSALEKTSELEEQEKKFGNAKDAKARLKKVFEDISKLASQDSKLALGLGELKKDLIKKEEELAKAQIVSDSAREILLQDRALKEIIGRKKSVPGILGTVAELGKVDPEYSAALSIAAGNRMRQVVVENVDTAIKCLELLKGSRAGIATFLPLDKLRVQDDGEIRNILKKPGILGLAADLITCESKFKNLFRYIFRNTVIIKDVSAAKSLGISKYRMVTLDGDLFEQSGAITGGFREKGAGIKFEQTDLRGAIVKVEADISKLNSEVQAKESERLTLEKQIEELRREKAELEGRAEVAKEFDFDVVDKLRKTSEQIKLSIEKKKTDLEKSEKDFSEKLAERNALKMQVHQLRFGGRKELDELVQKKIQLESALAAARATLENGLQPEKESIQKVLKELEKEKKDFEKQISQKESEIKTVEKELEKKEQEQEAFHGKLKNLFEQQNELGVKLRDEESSQNKVLLATSQAEQEKNNLAIEKAQHEAELTALLTELEPIKDIPILENLKSIESAKSKIREFNNKLTTLGNVNMRALEIFESVQTEYGDLATKVSTLQTEKNDVLLIIDEVEKKKSDAFMKTYNEIATNFAETHKKIADKNHANLELENPEKPFEGGVVVRVTDLKGKRGSLAGLSGGEKVLVALSLLFAIQEHEPAPFYLMDEIDAALDKVNSEKVAKLLREYSKKAQIIVISHNDAIISESDNLYGISMTKEGESSIVSLKI